MAASITLRCFSQPSLIMTMPMIIMMMNIIDVKSHVESEDGQIEDSSALPNEPKMWALNDFVQSLACRAGRNANLGSDRERQQIMAGVSSLRGDKCIMQLQSSHSTCCSCIVLQHCALCSNIVQAGRRKADGSRYQPLPSAISFYIAFPASVYMCLFPLQLLSQLQHFQSVISYMFMYISIYHRVCKER